MEWGAFGDGTNFLPLTDADRFIDHHSPNVDHQWFEKSISGMYLGEIARFILADLCENQVVFTNQAVALVLNRGSFETADVAEVLADHSQELSGVEVVLQRRFKLQSTLAERFTVHNVCRFVVHRAARLSGMAIAAVLLHLPASRRENSVVAVDGGVYEKMPTFKETMVTTIHDLLPAAAVRVTLSKDGSGIGAAVIAATVV